MDGLLDHMGFGKAKRLDGDATLVPDLLPVLHLTIADIFG